MTQEMVDYMNDLNKQTFTISDLLKLFKKNININEIKGILFSTTDEIACGEKKNNFYTTVCMEKCLVAIKEIQKNKRLKIANNDYVQPNIEEYTQLIKCNYSVSQLKMMCRHYKQRLSGNKNELQNRLFFYMMRSCDAKKIQIAWRNHIIKQYRYLRGPAALNRSLCVNDTDFCSMENIKDISFTQFFSYKDTDDMVYGFDLTSLFTLLSKGNINTPNPYNRNIVPKSVRKKINTILRISRILNDAIVIDIESPQEISSEKKMEQRIQDIFHDMDLLGNYTNTTWFTSLSRVSLIRFIRELADIWMYRAQLSQQTKNEICPPYGNPFGSILSILISTSTENLKNLALSIIEKMVKTGLDDASKCLGTNYVLCAFTLVNSNARETLPWLYQSVV